MGVDRLRSVVPMVSGLNVDVQFRILSPEQIDSAYRLRYDVYCTERGYIAPNDEQIERDEFDDAAVHIGALVDDQLIAYLRLVIPSPRGLPMLSQCTLYPDYEYLKSDPTCGEISRFVIPRSNRARRLALNLYRTVSAEVSARGLRHCIAAMEPGLAWLISRAGFTVNRIGPNACCIGARNPYLLADPIAK
jgi:N-acyl-L-homoserine lactone synthetase